MGMVRAYVSWNFPTNTLPHTTIDFLGLCQVCDFLISPEAVWLMDGRCGVKFSILHVFLH